MHTIRLTEEERASGRENFDFYCFLIWPFIEASWLGAVSILMLTPPHTGAESSISSANDDWVDLRQVQNYAQLLGKTFYHQGDLSYFEAVNKESLSKGYARVEEEGVLEVVRSKETKDPPRVRLDESWAPSRDAQGKLVVDGSKLWELCERISLSRREGKNRRDGETVQTRVVELVDKVGEQMWAKARLPVGGAQIELGIKPKAPRRKLQVRPKM